MLSKFKAYRSSAYSYLQGTGTVLSIAIVTIVSNFKSDCTTHLSKSSCPAILDSSVEVVADSSCLHNH